MPKLTRRDCATSHRQVLRMLTEVGSSSEYCRLLAALTAVGAVVALALLPSPAVAAPVVTWHSDPVAPDEVVVVRGGDFGAAPTVLVGRLRDDLESMAAGELWARVADPQAVTPLQVSNHSLKFVLPAGLKPGQFAYRVQNGAELSAPRVLNAPDVWWLQGDRGEGAAPGGWVRLFGKCLNLGGTTQVTLTGTNGEAITLAAQTADGWAVRVDVPATLPPGAYAVTLHNGGGGSAAWVPAGKLTVAPPEAWKTEVFSVKDVGTDSDAAVRAALAKVEESGGGVVYFPRGRYAIKGDLKLPSGTVLRGEGMGLVSLYWPDMEQPPVDLIHGRRFGIEDLSIYVQNHRNVVDDEDGSTGTFLRRVRIRANCYFMIEDSAKEFRGRHGPASHTNCGAAVMVRARNFEITDCDIYASNLALRVHKGKFGLIARNRFQYGGRGYTIENTDGLIYEDNAVSGNHLLAIGNDLSTFWTAYCRNVYYARNRISDVYGADREMMTLDAAGGAYFGQLAAVDGAKLTLAADPVFKDYAPKPHTNWVGAVVQVLDGKGAGQYRFVTAHAGREWQVDRPWTVAPDTTSRISIAPFRGRNLFIGNRFEDGGPFQLYGAAHDSIVAGNRGSRMDGFLVWGLNPHRRGQQPSWGCQFFNNEIVEGKSYGPRAVSFGIVAGDDPKVYDGPMVRGAIFRRNVLHNNASIVVGGVTEDVLVEHCTVRNTDTGITVKPTARGVLLRDNRFENVAQPVLQPPSAPNATAK